MGDALLVQEIQSGGDLLDDLRGLVLREADMLLDTRQQWPTIDLLEHQIELLIVLEELDQLQDTGMALTMMECLHFAKNTGAGMTRYFIDHFHGILQVRVDVDTRLDRGIGALTQNLASQLIKL